MKLIFAILLAVYSFSSLEVKALTDKKLVCYYGSWAVYRPGAGKFPVENIDPFLCTHLVYGFAGLSYSNTIRPLDEWNDLEDNYGKGAFKRFTNLKQKNPSLKTIIAIGGWNEGSTKYSAMAANPGTRKTFVDSVVAFLKKYDFDGLDMDWEYPANRGGKPEDKQNFVSLLKELHEAFQPHGLLLTAATSAGKPTIDTAYDIPSMSKYLDIINLMAYDYHGGWESFTGHNSPLYARPDETPEQQILNMNFSVNYWLQHGAPKDKLVLGMGTYGRAFTLQNPSNHGLYAPAPSPGQQGPYTREAGMLGYNEICEKGSQWTVVWDEYYNAPYAYHDRQWVGYDDPKSIKIKSEYAKNLGLAGAMIWSIETDDFRGVCHGYPYPLLTTIHETLIGPVDQHPDPPTPDYHTNPTAGPTDETHTDGETEGTHKPPVDRNCQEEGWFRDPKDCSQYWRCYRVGDHLEAEQLECQQGTLFDLTILSCNWPPVAGCS